MPLSFASQPRWGGPCCDSGINAKSCLPISPNCVFDASLVPETCLEFPEFASANALRLGASTLLKSQTHLGAQYRRLRTKLGAPKAITAMAHRLARLVYRMLKYGQQYVDKGAEYYERRNRQQQIEFVRKRAAQLGLRVTQLNA